MYNTHINSIVIYIILLYYFIRKRNIET